MLWVITINLFIKTKAHSNNYFSNLSSHLVTTHLPGQHCRSHSLDVAQSACGANRPDDRQRESQHGRQGIASRHQGETASTESGARLMLAVAAALATNGRAATSIAAECCDSAAAAVGAHSGCVSHLFVHMCIVFDDGGRRKKVCGDNWDTKGEMPNVCTL